MSSLRCGGNSVCSLNNVATLRLCRCLHAPRASQCTGSTRTRPNVPLLVLVHTTVRQRWFRFFLDHLLPCLFFGGRKSNVVALVWHGLLVGQRDLLYMGFVLYVSYMGFLNRPIIKWGMFGYNAPALRRVP